MTLEIIFLVRKNAQIKILSKKCTIFSHASEREYNHELNRRKIYINSIKVLIYNMGNTKENLRSIRIMLNCENFEDLYMTKKVVKKAYCVI